MNIGDRFNPFGLFQGSFIPNCIMRLPASEMQPAEKLIWARLGQYAGRDGRCYPSQERLASEVGMKPNTVSKWLRSLQKKGFIYIERPEGADLLLHKHNSYYFLWHKAFETVIENEYAPTEDDPTEDDPTEDDPSRDCGLIPPTPAPQGSRDYGLIPRTPAQQGSRLGQAHESGLGQAHESLYKDGSIKDNSPSNNNLRESDIKSKSSNTDIKNENGGDGEMNIESTPNKSKHATSQDTNQNTPIKSRRSFPNCSAAGAQPEPKRDKPSIAERTTRYLPHAEKLADIVRSTKRIRISPQQKKSWANEIRKLCEMGRINPKRVERALDWYAENAGGEYIPVIESGTSLREKFSRLEAAIERAGGYRPKQEQKQKQEKPVVDEWDRRQRRKEALKQLGKEAERIKKETGKNPSWVFDPAVHAPDIM